MKITLVALVSALATTAFAWPKADIVFKDSGDKQAKQTFNANGRAQKIRKILSCCTMYTARRLKRLENNLVVAQITSKSSVACTYTAADGSKQYTRNFQTVQVRRPKKFETVSCVIE